MQTEIPSYEAQYVYDSGIDRVLQLQQLKDSLNKNPNAKLGFKKADEYVKFKVRVMKEIRKIESKITAKTQTNLF